MTSIALLDHAVAARPDPPFNSNLYFAAATVIPVLFLAIAVQGRTYETMVNNSIRAAAAARIAKLSRPWRKRILTEIRSLAYGVGPGLILVYGAVGEVTAILILQNQADVGPSQGIVTFAVVVLTIVAAARPAQILAKSLLTIRRQQTPSDIWRARHSRKVRKLESGKGLTPGYAYPQQAKRLSRLRSRIRAREPGRVNAARSPGTGGSETEPGKTDTPLPGREISE
jgi:hypothetical protein